MKKLHEYGVDLDQTRTDDMTIAHIAIQKGSINIIQ
ncbi:ankyrin repeat domain-containing protein [Legionella brunensis]